MSDEQELKAKEPELMITIPLAEYNLLNGLVGNFKSLCESNAALIEDHYKQRIEYLEMKLRNKRAEGERE